MSCVALARTNETDRVLPAGRQTHSKLNYQTAVEIETA